MNVGNKKSARGSGSRGQLLIPERLPCTGQFLYPDLYTEMNVKCEPDPIIGKMSQAKCLSLKPISRYVRLPNHAKSEDVVNVWNFTS
jgi:hypothetical protein